MKIPQLSGIYTINNTVDGKVYVGSSANLYERKAAHWNHLKNNKHHNPHLQNAWNKYGKDCFVFEAVMVVPIICLIEFEQKIVDHLKTRGESLYNMRVCVETCLGVKRSDEFRRQSSLRNVGKVLTEEHKIKISLSEMCRPYPALISPNGELYESGIHRKAFCEQHDLNRTGFGKLCAGFIKSHKGWRLAG